MKLNKKWFIIILSIVILISSGAVTTYLILKGRKVTAQDLYNRAKVLVSERKFDQARVYFYDALKKSTENADLFWEVASFEAQMGDSSQAQTYAQKAWGAGKRDKECFMALLTHSGLPTLTLQVEYGHRLLKDLTDLKLKQELEGDLYFAIKDYISALDLYKKIYADRPTADLSVKIAIVLMSSNKTAAAIDFLQLAIDESVFNDRSYSMLVNLKFLKDRQLDLDKEYKRAESLGVKSFHFRYQKAFLLTVSHQSRKALLTLEQLLVREGTHKDATKARILMAYNAYTLKEIDKIGLLLNRLQGVDSPEAEGERKFYQILKEMSQANKEELKAAASLQKSLQDIHKLLPDNFIVGLFDARLKALSGDLEGALSFYNQEEDPLHKLWSRFSLDHVYALQKSGRIDEALALLSSFHQFMGKGSLESLSLQRNLFLANARYEKALAVQGLLEKLFPENDSLHLQRASILLESGQLVEARDFLISYKKRVSTALKNSLDELLILVNLGLGEYEKVVAIAEERPSFSLYKAQALNGLKKYGEAGELYFKNLREKPSPRNGRALLFYLISRKKIAEAKQLMNQFSNSVFKDQGWLLLAYALLETSENNFDEALSYLQKVKDFPEEYNAALFLESDIFYRQGRHLNALSHLNLLTIYTPKDYRVFHLKALCYLQTGDSRNARQSIKDALSLQPKSPLLEMTHSTILYEEGELAEALSKAQSLLAYPVLYQSAFDVCLNVFINQGKLSAALDFIKENSIGRSPVDQAQLRADVYFKLGEPKKALAILEEYRALMPVKIRIAFMKANLPGMNSIVLDNLEMSVPLWSDLASLLIAKKVYHQAAFCYLKVVEGKTSDAVIRNNLAWCYLSLNQLGEAEKWAKEAKALEPRNNEIIHTLSQVLFKLKKYKECQDLLEPVVAKSIVDARHNYTLGAVYEALDKPKEALFQYRESLNKASEGNWSLPISKEKLLQRVESLGQ